NLQKLLPSTFYEMMRSYIEFADKLNISEASANLAISRQTLKRHLTELQTLTGKTFFRSMGNKFELTEDGAAAKVEAKSLLVLTDKWVKRTSASGLQFTQEVFSEEDKYLFVQDHPIIDVWHVAPPLLREGLSCWVNASGHLEHKAMNKIRPYLIVFREYEGAWMCFEIGEKSSIAEWLGWNWAKSAIGTFLDSDSVVSQNGREMTDAYDVAARSGGLCYEHICALLPKPDCEKLLHVNYQRLIFSCLLPNNEKVLASLVCRTNEVRINGIDPENIPLMNEEYITKYC
ncbi:MAG: hypothetical protein AAGA53_16450, partial [Pseudomonadota bacterium]